MKLLLALLDGVPCASGLSAPCARRNPVPLACFFFAAGDLGGATQSLEIICTKYDDLDKRTALK